MCHNIINLVNISIRTSAPVAKDNFDSLFYFAEWQIQARTGTSSRVGYLVLGLELWPHEA
jgi:hypothetical protein